MLIFDAILLENKCKGNLLEEILFDLALD